MPPADWSPRSSDDFDAVTEALESLTGDERELLDGLAAMIASSSTAAPVASRSDWELDAFERSAIWNHVQQLIAADDDRDAPEP